ncbi:RDD family protein [Streptomyces sp. NPDC050658]|uniref:RDD family protein n=1 Tax=unclassified Streptomyces TaxID=2593676 RepID=UPI003414C74F
MTEADGGRGPRADAAGIVSRGVAAVVDALVLALMGLAVQVGAGCALLLAEGPPFRFPEFPVWLSAPVSWTVAVAYLGGAWSAIGSTPGCRLMGLRVTDRAGRLLGLPRALARAALCVTVPLGLCWIPFSRRRAALQDLLVASAVSYDRR